MPENNPVIPSATTQKMKEPIPNRQRLLEKSNEMAERSRSKVEVENDVTPKENPSDGEQRKQPKRRVVKPKEKTTTKGIIFEENSQLEEKLGVGKRLKFEEANTRVTTYIDNDHLAKLRTIKKDYNVPMTEVIHKALAAYLTT